MSPVTEGPKLSTTQQKSLPHQLKGLTSQTLPRFSIQFGKNTFSCIRNIFNTVDRH